MGNTNLDCADACRRRYFLVSPRKYPKRRPGAARYVLLPPSKPPSPRPLPAALSFLRFYICLPAKCYALNDCLRLKSRESVGFCGVASIPSPGERVPRRGGCGMRAESYHFSVSSYFFPPPSASLTPPPWRGYVGCGKILNYQLSILNYQLSIFSRFLCI